MTEKEFDPNTMTLASQADFDCMWFRLWRTMTWVEVADMTAHYMQTGEEPRDFTQI